MKKSSSKLSNKQQQAIQTCNTIETQRTTLNETNNNTQIPIGSKSAIQINKNNNIKTITSPKFQKHGQKANMFTSYGFGTPITAQILLGSMSKSSSIVQLKNPNDINLVDKENNKNAGNILPSNNKMINSPKNRLASPENKFSNNTRAYSKILNSFYNKEHLKFGKKSPNSDYHKFMSGKYDTSHSITPTSSTTRNPSMIINEFIVPQSTILNSKKTLFDVEMVTSIVKNTRDDNNVMIDPSHKLNLQRDLDTNSKLSNTDLVKVNTNNHIIKMDTANFSTLSTSATSNFPPIVEDIKLHSGTLNTPGSEVIYDRRQSIEQALNITFDQFEHCKQGKDQTQKKESSSMPILVEHSTLHFHNKSSPSSLKIKNDIDLTISDPTTDMEIHKESPLKHIGPLISTNDNSDHQKLPILALSYDTKSNEPNQRREEISSFVYNIIEAIHGMRKFGETLLEEKNKMQMVYKNGLENIEQFAIRLTSIINELKEDFILNWNTDYHKELLKYQDKEKQILLFIRDAEGMKNDIQENLDNIIHNIGQLPYRVIMDKYEEKLKNCSKLTSYAMNNNFIHTHKLTQTMMEFNHDVKNIIHKILDDPKHELFGDANFLSKFRDKTEYSKTLKEFEEFLKYEENENGMNTSANNKSKLTPIIISFENKDLFENALKCSEEGFSSANHNTSSNFASNNIYKINNKEFKSDYYAGYDNSKENTRFQFFNPPNLNGNLSEMKLSNLQYFFNGEKTQMAMWDNNSETNSRIKTLKDDQEHSMDLIEAKLEEESSKLSRWSCPKSFSYSPNFKQNPIDN